jgi:hypothetical protein
VTRGATNTPPPNRPPVQSPVQAPVQAPAQVPVQAPVQAPVQSPVPAPVASPVAQPTRYVPPPFIQISLFADLNCNAEIFLQATLGINICLSLDANSDGANSMMYTYDSLNLEVTLFTDGACSRPMGSHLIGVVANLVNQQCTNGVVVITVNSYNSLPAPPRGGGELIR